MRIAKQIYKLSFLNSNQNLSIEVCWISFRDRFDSSTHKNTDLTDIDKFSPLQPFLCSPSSESIYGLARTAENYT